VMDFLKGKNILIISPEAWGLSYLSKHHFALELAKQNKVWFLNPPHSKVHNEDYPDLPNSVALMNDSQIPGMRHLPQRLQRLIITKQYEKLENTAGVKFQVVWNFDNSRYFHHGCFYDAYTIHHVVDEHMNYNFVTASRSAELCLGVTHRIVDNMKKYNPHAHFIDHALTPFEYSEVEPVKKPGRRLVAYTGNLLLEALDLQLLIDLATELTNTDFLLIGSSEKNHLNVGKKASPPELLNKLKNMENVRFTGELKFQFAFSLAAQADVQIVPYFNAGTPMTNSSKLPFYLYNGNVTVSNEFTEHHHHGLLRMAGTASEFKMLLRDTLDNLTYWNSNTMREKRRSYALQNTYEKRIHFIDQLITDSHP
jgi:hypothetical protein